MWDVVMSVYSKAFYSLDLMALDSRSIFIIKQNHIEPNSENPIHISFPILAMRSIINLHKARELPRLYQARVLGVGAFRWNYEVDSLRKSHPLFSLPSQVPRL